MNKLQALSVALVVLANLSSAANAGDVFDGPGPGYRQQIERLTPTVDRALYLSIRIESPALLLPASKSPAPDFSQSIRLFDQSAQLPPVLDSQGMGVPAKFW